MSLAIWEYFWNPSDWVQSTSTVTINPGVLSPFSSSSFVSTWEWLPGDQGGLNRFLLEHYVEHRRMNDALLSLNPAFVPVDLPIQRMDDPEEWLDAHQRMTQSVWTGIGGGQTTDFERLDFNSPTDLTDWQNIHHLWHMQARASLGM